MLLHKGIRLRGIELNVTQSNSFTMDEVGALNVQGYRTRSGREIENSAQAREALESYERLQTAGLGDTAHNRRVLEGFRRTKKEKDERYDSRSETSQQILKAREEKSNGVVDKVYASVEGDFASERVLPDPSARNELFLKFLTCAVCDRSLSEGVQTFLVTEDQNDLFETITRVCDASHYPGGLHRKLRKFYNICDILRCARFIDTLLSPKGIVVRQCNTTVSDDGDKFYDVHSGGASDVNLEIHPDMEEIRSSSPDDVNMYERSIWI